MANLRAIRTRIKSVENTRQITKSMKMVAAAKLRKTQNAFAALKRYAELSGYEKQLKNCPYEYESHRTDIHELFALAERMNPDARQSIWNALNMAGKLMEDY